MSYGFHGRLLQVDLTTRRVEELPISGEELRKYYGGSGLAARLLIERLDPTIDPLAPESPVAIIMGLMTGSIVPTSCKASICHRSPLTGIWNEATVGGHFPAGLRGAGVDGLLITGASDTPVTLVVEGGQVRFDDASTLWGKDTFDVADALKERYGKRARVFSIGPAGERCIPIAGIIADGRRARAAARGGPGAVFGSKKLKAIVALGRDFPKASDTPGLRATLKNQRGDIKTRAKGLRDFGTSGGVETVEFWGDLPIKNWQLGSWKEGAAKICSPNYFPRTLDRHEACHACPIRCSKIVKVTEGPYAGVHSHAPEYETLGGFGGNCMCDEAEAIMAANEYCNRMGLDTISAAGVVAFTMDAVDHGLLGPSDFHGKDIRWGDGQSILAVLEQLNNRDGIGDLLCQGVRKAGDELGPLAVELAVHTKGMEYALHDPRAFVSMALQYATDPRGACHLGGLTYFLGRGIPAPDLGFLEAQDPHTSEGKASIVVPMQNYLGNFNPLGLCKFLFLAQIGPKIIAEWISKTTGWDMDMDEFMTTGDRVFNLKRMYNVRLGVTRKDDTIPPRLATHARPDGRSAGSLPHMGKMLHEYYALRGWSPEGIPTREKLEALGLGNFLEGAA